MQSKARTVTFINRIAGTVTTHEGSPFTLLKEVLERYATNEDRFSESPFVFGGIGYFAYDLCHFIEKLPQRAVDDLVLPDLYFCFFNKILTYDHQYKKWYLSYTEMEGCKEHLSDIKESIIAKVERQSISTVRYTMKSDGQLISNFSKQEYLLAIEKAISYILEGDIYQVNLSQRFKTKADMEPYQLYVKLREINPAPFAAFLNFPEVKVISSSPERFLKVAQGKVQTRPIKGTRPRSTDELVDTRLKQELVESEKDSAELNMIVDLERNDLGKVCNYGSVKVEEHRVVETYPTVFHTVSTVVGELLPQYKIVDLLKATFPGGSITGAPKVRAMEIIDELEPTKRNLYTGSIGYIGFNGDMDINIAIRTIVMKDGQAYFQVGGGIVADSVPELEYRETLDKGRALADALTQGASRL
ncbi:MAG: aminodeoxychorismate synthase component I, partial [Thermodesulfobacteriota bacterium]|nr:aminodeoxychorismate synthase component I [Thermodesulfobacteriota bacterium]